MGICNETVTALLKDPSPASFILFPVPATDLLYVKLTDVLEDINYEITSLTGMIVGSGKIPANTGIADIPVQDLQPGVYYLHCRNQRIISNSNFTIIR